MVAPSLSYYCIIRSYLKQNSKPTFNGFVSKNIKAVQEASVLLKDITSALQLQRHWTIKYNKNARVARPTTKLFTPPKRASQNFLLIYKITKLERTLNLKFEIGKLTVRNEILDSINNEKDETDEEDVIEENESVQEESAEVTQFEVEQHTQNENAQIVQEDQICLGKEQDNVNTSLDYFLKRQSRCIDDESLKKLLDSSCINLIRDEGKRKYAKLLPPDVHKSLIIKCQQKKQEFESSLPPHLLSMINALFDDLKPFIFDNSTHRILNFIDTRKAKETDKTSETYKLLSMIDAVVMNMKQYKRELKLSESSHLHAFHNALRPLLDETHVILKEGETVSVSTQRMQIMNEIDTTYGRRIDIIVASNSDTDNDDVEICSIEFKKSNVTTATLQQQQNKNLRINSCVLNDIHLFTQDTNHQLIYFDFAGKSAYMVQLYRHENCFVGHKIGSFSLISSLVELQQLRKSVINLYLWREFAVDLSNAIKLSHVDQSYKYDLIDVSDYVSTSPLGSPKRKIDPVNVYLSPSNQSKRTKRMTDQ